MSAGFPEVRMRRLRGTRALRSMVAETSLRPAELVLPVFIKEGIADPQPISSMPGVVQHTRDSLRKAAGDAVEAGRRRPDRVRHPCGQGRPGQRGRRPGRHLPARPGRHPGGGGRRPRADGRPVPVRVHRSRPLRHRHARRRGGQRRHARPLRVHRRRPGPGRRARHRAERHDGRPGGAVVAGLVGLAFYRCNAKKTTEDGGGRSSGSAYIDPNIVKNGWRGDDRREPGSERAGAPRSRSTRSSRRQRCPPVPGTADVQGARQAARRAVRGQRVGRLGADHLREPGQQGRRRSGRTPRAASSRSSSSLIDDPVAMGNTFANGDVHIGWATVDMLPLIIERLKRDPRTMPRVYQQIDWSNGGDGIVVARRHQERRRPARQDRRARAELAVALLPAQRAAQRRRPAVRGEDEVHEGRVPGRRGVQPEQGHRRRACRGRPTSTRSTEDRQGQQAAGRRR